MSLLKRIAFLTAIHYTHTCNGLLQAHDNFRLPLLLFLPCKQCAVFIPTPETLAGTLLAPPLTTGIVVNIVLFFTVNTDVPPPTVAAAAILALTAAPPNAVTSG